MVGVPYAAQLSLSGSHFPYHWYLGGRLPAGLSFDYTTGTISGTPTTAGTTAVTIGAIDPDNVSSSSTVTLTIAPPAPVVTGLSVHSGKAFQSWVTIQGYNLVRAGSTSPFT